MMAKTEDKLLQKEGVKKRIREHELVILVAVLLVGILIGNLVVAGPSNTRQCSDKLDNDGDQRIDYPNDPGCSSKRDNSERGTIACDNGVDDDGDTRSDYPNDPGCSSPSDTSEQSTVQCDDGIDNGDADALKDYGNDPGCSSLTDDIEADGQCDDTIDNDGDTKIDFPNDAGCTGFSDSSEYSINECDDGIDNDGDLKIDYPYDLGCASSTDTSEIDIVQINCGDSVCSTGETSTNCPADCSTPSIYYTLENPKLTVLSPNGGEALQKGIAYPIRWRVTASNQVSSPLPTLIYIDIVDKCAAYIKYYTITTNANSILGDNEYVWSPPAIFQDAAVYRVNIGVQQTYQPGIISFFYNRSDDNFVIYETDPALALKSFFLTNAKVSLIYPNGGESLAKGQTYTLEWNFTREPDQLTGPFDTTIAWQDISGTAERTAYLIAQNQPLTVEGSNQYTWTYPTNAVEIDGTPLEGGNYRLLVEVKKITYDTSLEVCALPKDESNSNVGLAAAANLGVPSIILTYPNGGENLAFNTDSSIIFSIGGYSSGTPLTIIAELIKNGVALGRIQAGGSVKINSDTTALSWKVGTHYGFSGTTPTQVSGTGFKIRTIIYYNNLWVASDESDSTFTIA